MLKPNFLTTPIFMFFMLLSQSSIVHATLDRSLEDWAFNIDGNVSEASFGDPNPATGTLVDGLGTLSVDVTGLGSHSVIGFLDFELFEGFNTFYNEFGVATGTPQIGQSWEIDEPGFIFGDIYDNVLNGSLDNSNGVSAGFEDDVSIAFGWDFSLFANDLATISFTITDILPTVDFFLTQTDPDLNQSIYFYSALDIQITGGPAGPATIPEPSVLYLLLFAGFGLLIQKKIKK